MIKKEKNKGEKKREQILEAALECFLEKGYGNASISDIMARAKISKGGIYWYFQCKDEIYVAMVEEWYDRIWFDHVIQEVEKKETAVEKLICYGELYCAAVGNPFLSILPESFLGSLVENYHDRLYAVYKKDDDFIKTLFEKALKNDEIEANDVDGLVFIYTSLLEGMYTQMLFKSKKEERLKQHYFEGIHLFFKSIEKQRHPQP